MLEPTLPAAGLKILKFPIQIKYERQLKALTDDLAKVECLLETLTDQSIIDFQLENPDIIPELSDLYDLKPISLDSSFYTMSSNSESFLLRSRAT